MKKNSNKEPTYEDLKKIYTDEEMAESLVFRSTMSAEEREEADKEFLKLRMESLKAMSDQQRLQSELMRMRLLMDDYFKQPAYSEEFSFAKQLQSYLQLLKRTQKDLASEIDLHPTKLSRILNNREEPNVDLMYRLELHCGMMIPATHWFKLQSRKLEQQIKKDAVRRKLEYEKVRNELKFVKVG